MPDPATILPQAVALQREGRLDEAARLLEAALAAEPGNPDALHFYGLLHFQRGARERAVELIRESLAIAPAQAGARNNLGNVLRALGRDAEALECYLAALGIDPGHAEAWCNIGVLLRNAGRIEEAIEALRQAVSLDPRHGESWHNLGLCHLLEPELEKAADSFQRCYDSGAAGGWSDPVWHARVLCALGRREKAIAILEAQVTGRPDDAVARHQLAALRGEAPARADDAYVRSHFDRFADSFDAVLRRLDYRAPEIVAERVARHCADSAVVPDVVDLGCGTGLLGPLVRQRSGQLTGVDLSPGMLRRAAAREVYDYLVEGELTAFLAEAPPACFDLALAVDTLCYFGALDRVLGGLVRALKPGGLFIATVERFAGPDFRIDPSGRYAHSADYLRRAAGAAGLGVVEIEPVVLRHELGRPVEGLVFALRAA